MFTLQLQLVFVQAYWNPEHVSSQSAELPSFAEACRYSGHTVDPSNALHLCSAVENVIGSAK